jgi:hypothetical protein
VNAHWTNQLSLLAVLVSAFLIGCPPPGKGAKAERGYRRAEPVVAALEKFHVDHGAYPADRSELVPAYLTADQLATPTRTHENYPLEYRRVGEDYELSFHYTGPGTNICVYGPPKEWKCYVRGILKGASLTGRSIGPHARANSWGTQSIRFACGRSAPER